MNRARTKKRAVSQNDDIRARHIKRQKKRRKRRIFFRTFLLMLLLVIVCTTVMFLTPWFNISAIDVNGISHLNGDDIRACSGIYIGNNMFKISTSHARDKISALPYVKEVEVKRNFPKKVEINIVESHARAYFEYMGGYAVIDEDGKALEIMSEEPQNCIQIMGCELKDFSLGKKISIDSAEKFDIILLYIGELEKTEFYGGVNKLDLTNTVDIKFTFENRLTVFCGDISGLNRKILTFTEIAYNQLSPNARGEIDLRIDGSAYYRP